MPESQDLGVWVGTAPPPQGRVPESPGMPAPQLRPSGAWTPLSSKAVAVGQRRVTASCCLCYKEVGAVAPSPPLPAGTSTAHHSQKSGPPTSWVLRMSRPQRPCPQQTQKSRGAGAKALEPQARPSGGALAGLAATSILCSELAFRAEPAQGGVGRARVTPRELRSGKLAWRR